MINLSLKRYLPAWFRSETGDFYLTILFTTVATAELTYWGLSALVAESSYLFDSLPLVARHVSSSN